VNTLDVGPPEIQSRYNTECCGERKWRNGRSRVQHLRNFVDDSSKILSGADDAYRTRQDVIENKSGNRKTSQKWPHRVAYDDVHTAAYIHAAAFQVHRPHGKTEQHDGENEPWRAFTDRVFGDAARIKSRRCQIAQHDCCAAPERNERKHYSARHNDSRR